MLINSTEFQQNVGYYLNLAEKGAVVHITKSKPRKSEYQLKVVKATANDNNEAKLLKIFKKIERLNNDFGFYGNDAVDYVRKIRE